MQCTKHGPTFTVAVMCGQVVCEYCQQYAAACSDHKYLLKELDIDYLE